MILSLLFCLFQDRPPTKVCYVSEPIYAILRRDDGIKVVFTQIGMDLLPSYIDWIQIGSKDAFKVDGSLFIEGKGDGYTIKDGLLFSPKGDIIQGDYPAHSIQKAL